MKITPSPLRAPGSAPRTSKPLRDLHVKGIPEDVWCRARCNALLSRMSFKEYVVRLLGQSVPLLPTTEPRAESAT